MNNSLRITIVGDTQRQGQITVNKMGTVIPWQEAENACFRSFHFTELDIHINANEISRYHGRLSWWSQVREGGTESDTERDRESER